VIVTVYVPDVPKLGDPESTPVDELNDTPCGKPPDNEKDGDPLALTWKYR